MKPEKFQAQQENMMASMRKRGVCHISLARFSQDLNSEKWIQFHAYTFINPLASFGTDEATVNNQLFRNRMTNLLHI